MSNCISLADNRVEFQYGEIDSAKLEQLIAPHKEHGYPPNSEDWVCWFLRDNTSFDMGGGVTIRFGEGQSSHTWRDFRYIILQLKEYMLTDKWHEFQVEDEGFPGWGPMRINFKTGEGIL